MDRLFIRLDDINLNDVSDFVLFVTNKEAYRDGSIHYILQNDVGFRVFVDYVKGSIKDCSEFADKKWIYLPNPKIIVKRNFITWDRSCLAIIAEDKDANQLAFSFYPKIINFEE